VDVLVVQPQADVMRMIDTLSVSRIERPAAGGERAVRVADGVEHRLLHRVGPDVRREGLAADGDVDAPCRFVDRDVNRSGGGDAREHQAGESESGKRQTHAPDSLWGGYFSGKVCRT